MEVRHLISIEDVSIKWWNGLYKLCCDIIARPNDYSLSCSGRVMASLFYEPSTRTNFSFQSAMMRLGGSVFGFTEPSGTSMSKGESLADTVRMMSAYSDTIVIRSPYEGAAKAASLYSDVPIINAGDGGHFHPTQTLADLTTISQKRGGIGDLNIGLCGDLMNGRTVHSLVSALAKFKNINFYLISPRELAMPDYMLAQLKKHKQKYIEVTSLEETLPQLDVLYMTRIQRERFNDPKDFERLKSVYVLSKRKLQQAKKDCLVMHPLPRVDEISRDVDHDPRAVYFEQARYGMFIRMALLLKMSHYEREMPSEVKANTKSRCENFNCITQTEPYLPALSKKSGLESCSYCDKKMLTI